MRPDPIRWLWYAYGGGLPERFRPWVLHDTTCRTWVLRHVARILVMVAPPIAAVIVFVPGPLWLRAACAFLGFLMAMVWGCSLIDLTVEHRLVKAGYPAGTGDAVRLDRARRERSEASRKRADALRSKRAAATRKRRENTHAVVR